MVLETDTKFEEKKLTCDLKNGMRNLENFPRAHKSFKISKQKMHELKNHREAIWYDNEE